MIRHRIAIMILTLAATLPLAVGGTVGGASAAAIAAHTTHRHAASQLDAVGGSSLCAQSGTDGLCLKPAGGTFTDGNSIDIGEDSWGVGFVNEGQVSTVSCWPFTCFSNCNSRYAGFTVVNVIWDADVNFAVRDYTNRNDQVAMSDSWDNNALWVVSGGWWINVGATNNAGVNCHNGNPYILTYRPNTSTVWSSCGGCYDAWKQNWQLRATGT